MGFMFAGHYFFFNKNKNLYYKKTRSMYKKRYKKLFEVEGRHVAEKIFTIQETIFQKSQYQYVQRR